MNPIFKIIPCDVAMPSISDSIIDLIIENKLFVIFLLVVLLLIAAIVTMIIVSAKKSRDVKNNQLSDDTQENEPWQK